MLESRLAEWRTHEAWGLAEANIRDKGNEDGTVKLAALCRVLWFVAQCIMRAVHGLPPCQLESMTLGYIPLFAVTYFFWWLKPEDVMTPSVVDLSEINPEQRMVFESMAVSNSFDDEGPSGPRGSLWSYGL